MSAQAHALLAGNPVIDHLDLWSSVYVKRATTGRGSNGKISPYGIQKLRELILELAFSGRLVPNDDNNVNYDDLLSKMALERDEYHKQKGVRLQKFKKIVGEVKDHGVPDSWTVVYFDQVIKYITDFQANGSFATLKKNVTYYDRPNYALLLRLTDLRHGLTDNSSYKYTDEAGYSFLSKSSIEGGELVVANVGAGVGTTLLVPEVTMPATLAPNMFMVVLSDLIDRNYFLYFSRSPEYWDYLNRVNVGTGQPKINKTEYKNCRLPLPSYEEQGRIVAKVDELMALCDQLEHQQTDSLHAHQTLVETLLAALVRPTAMDGGSEENAGAIFFEHFDTLFTTEESIDQLKQTILQLAVMGKLVPQDPSDEPASVLLGKIADEKARLVKEGKIKKQKALQNNNQEKQPFVLPTGWQFVQFDSVVDITSGITKGRKLSGRVLVSVPYLRVANVQRGFLELGIMKEIEIPEDEIDKFTVVERDLLITEGGDWDKVGRTAIWRGELPLVAHQNHVFKARCILPEQNEIWLEKYLNSNLARDYFAGSSKQTTNLASINKTQLRGCIVAIPPLAEQHRIVTKVDELLSLCEALKARIQEAQATQVHLADAVVEQAVA